MRRRVLVKWFFELIALYAGWGFLDYAKGLLIDIYASNPLTLNTAVFGTIGIAAIVGAAILGTLLVQDLIGRTRAKKDPHAATRQQLETARALQLVPGGDELLRELERVEPSCGRIVQGLGVSGQNVNPLIIELSHLRFTLVELAGKYTGIWRPNLDNRVTMVANELGEAGSALSGEPLDIEHVKAHIDGAVQIARAFITELRSPPQVNNEKKSS
jgi:hypothetical protein